MKAILVTRDSTALADGTRVPVVRLYADSAIGRDTMPLFLPDIMPGCRARVCMAYRIGRLGKRIAPRFALRYIDAVSAVNVLGADDKLIESGYSSIIDSMVTTGMWIPLTATAETQIDLEVGDTAVADTVAGTGIAEIISGISLYTTIKSGDIVILQSHGVDIDPAPGTYITARVRGIECLRLKLK